MLQNYILDPVNPRKIVLNKIRVEFSFVYGGGHSENISQENFTTPTTVCDAIQVQNKRHKILQIRISTSYDSFIINFTFLENKRQEK